MWRWQLSSPDLEGCIGLLLLDDNARGRPRARCRGRLDGYAGLCAPSPSPSPSAACDISEPLRAKPGSLFRVAGVRHGEPRPGLDTVAMLPCKSFCNGAYSRGETTYTRGVNIREASSTRIDSL